MKAELGKWDNLVIGHDEMEQRQRAQNILKCMVIKGRTTYPDYIHITKNLREKDPSGFLKSGNNL